MRASLGLILAALLGAVVLAQGGGGTLIPRDAAAARPPQTGARVAGRVLAGDTNRPLPRAIVQLWVGSVATSRWTSTDADGRWAFENVAPGLYTLGASRDGYVQMRYGQKSPFSAATAVSVAVNQPLDKLDIVLPKGGVITGRIVDDLGDPIGGALAQAMRVKFVDGLRQLVPVVSGMGMIPQGVTDDRGEYRIYGLAAGVHYVSAAYTPGAPGVSDDRSAFPTTYYPGTVSIAEASGVTVVAGEDAVASFAMRPTTLANLSGRVLNSTGQPMSANLTLVPVAPGHAVEVSGRLVGRAGADGTFTIEHVPRGSYFLQARSLPAASDPEMQALQITMSEDTLQDLVVTTTAVGSVSGRLFLEGNPGAVQPDAFWFEVVPLTPGSMVSGPVGRGGGPPIFGLTRIDASGAFAINQVLGRQLLRFRNAPDGWWLKSIKVDGQDITDAGHEFRGGQGTANIEAVATQRMATLSGTVKDPGGQALSDYSVVAFSPDDSKWTPRTRFIATATPEKDGTFNLRGLPAGEYVVVAVAPLDAGDESDPERLSRWRKIGERVTLGEAQSRSVSLAPVR